MGLLQTCVKLLVPLVAINPSKWRIYTPVSCLFESTFVRSLKSKLVEPYQIYNDLNVFGFAIKTFPDGISEAFDSIVKMIPGGFSRSFYGICSMENGKLVYKATAEEIKPGEAEKYNYQRYQIEKGDYLTISITGWRKKIDQINKVFHQLMEDSRVDKTKPCVEWYKNDEELVCMIKMI